MQRRKFIKGVAAASAIAATASTVLASNIKASTSKQDDDEEANAACCDRTYESPAAAMSAPAETIAYVPAIFTGSEIQKPDYLATIDVDPESETYSQIISKLEMPNIGDELHHFGWNACSSCHGEEGKHRRFIILPGIKSGRIHIVDTSDPRAPVLHKVIEADEIAQKTNLSAPHTSHCLADGNIMISMLGDAEGEGPGGFLMLDSEFNVAGRWENDLSGMKFSYDFWYQPRFNTMISSEWGAPNTVSKGFDLEDVKAGKYGSQIHFWDWEAKTIKQTIDLGEAGLIPLEVRFHHDPDSPHGFVGAALSSTVWHYHLDGEHLGGEGEDAKWTADNVIQVEPVETEGWPFAVPGLITDLVLSMDDRFLYFSNWLHGDLRQYDVSDPANPKMTAQIWLGGVIGKTAEARGKKLEGGPQMLQLSLDGKRLYVTNSLYGPWDEQFYPDMSKNGSYLLKLDIDTENGGMTLNEDFMIDFGGDGESPARAHEIRFPGGDCTSDIWI